MRPSNFLLDVQCAPFRDDSKTARSPMGGRGVGHQKSKNWTQKDTGKKGGGVVINFDRAVYEQNVSL